MHLSRTSKQAYRAMLACVVAAGIAGKSSPLLSLFRGEHAIFAGMHFLTYACHAWLLVLWMLLMRHRLINRALINCLTAAGCTMLLWLLVRTIRFELARGYPTLGRYLWYAYYLGYTFIPTLLLLAMLHIGRREGDYIDRRWLLLLGGAAAASTLVLTNDFHQLVFRFGAEGMAHGAESHSYGAGYYLVIAWMVSQSVPAIAVAAHRCARMPRGTALLVPVAIFVTGVTYSLALALLPWFERVSPYKVTEAFCIAVVAFMESLVQLGLFPVNEFYDELWQASSLRGGLMSGSGAVVDASRNAPVVTRAEVGRALAQPVELQDHQLLAAQPVTGATAYWVRDLSFMHALQDHLAELGDVLEEENAVLTAENELARQRALVAQRQALYDTIHAHTADRLELLAAMLDGLPAEEEAFVAAMHRAALEATYLKRCANLILAGVEGTVDLRELALALEESAQWLRSCGAQVTLRTTGEGTLTLHEALERLEAYQTSVERLLPQLPAARFDCLLDLEGLHIEAGLADAVPGGGAP